MAEMTALDHAHTAMCNAGDDATLRLGFYERLADSELFIMLDTEPVGDKIDPRTFSVDATDYVLVFDREERLAAFAETTVPYAALSGRIIAAMLSDLGIGLGVNLGVAPSSILIPPDAVTWLADTVATQPSEDIDRALKVGSPHEVPQVVITSLNVKLSMAGNLANLAYLVSAEYDSGRKGHMLAFVGVLDGAEAALSKAVAEALVFSGIEAGEIDVAFFRNHDPICAKLAKVGLRFDLPESTVEKPKSGAPGMDPKRPPRLT